MTPKLGGENALVHPFHTIGHRFYTKDCCSGRPCFRKRSPTRRIQHRVVSRCKSLDIAEWDKKSVFLILDDFAHPSHIECYRRNLQSEGIDQDGSKPLLACRV